MAEKPSITKVRALLQRGRELLSAETIESAAHKAWIQSVAVRLRDAFGDSHYALPWPSTHINADKQEYLRRTLTEQVRYLEEILSHESDTADGVDDKRGTGPDLLDSFVSHSSKDENLAIALVGLLRTAIDIPPTMIRCTSAPGHKLEVGSDFEAQLRTETSRSTTFIPLVTPNSLESMFTGFEIGARWGSNREMLPILARGVTAGSIGRPLSSCTMISGTKKDEVCDFVNVVATRLARPVHQPSVWLKQLEEFVALAAESVTPRLGGNASLPGPIAIPTASSPALSKEASQVIVAASEGTSGTIRRDKEGFALKIRAYRQTFTANTGQERAILEEALRQLVSVGLVERTSDTVFRLTKKGYDVAAEEKRRELATTQANKDENVFTEHKGLRFKKKPDGTYHLAAYCPSCPMPLGGGDAGKHLTCAKCGFVSHYTGYHLSELVEEVQKASA